MVAHTPLPFDMSTVSKSETSRLVLNSPDGRRRTVRRGRRRRVPWSWVVPALVLLIAIHYIAVAAGAWYAFTDWSGSHAGAKFVGFSNFRAILHDPIARTALFNTLKLAVAFVVIVNVLGLLFALALNRAIKSRNFIRALFFAPVILSPLATSYLWSFIFDFNGPLNAFLKGVGLSSWRTAWLGSPTWALWTILVVLVWQFTGLAMVFYLAGLQSIPEELWEASAVDGASSIFRLRRVILPQLAPAITISVTFMSILGLRVFDQVMALTGGGPVNVSETLATQVYKQTWEYSRFGYGAALALVLALLIAIVAASQLVVLRARERRI